MNEHNRWIRRGLASCFLVFSGLTACADLDVVYQDAPDRARAIASAGDVESLISGSFKRWWDANHDFGPPPILGNQTFMWSGWPANFGMVFYSSFPRIPIVNIATDQFYGNMVGWPWTSLYRGASAIATGFQSLEDPEIAAELGEARVKRLRAYGKFVQGLVYGSLSMLYDEAFIVDETTDLAATPEAVGYQEVLAASVGYFQEAITLANQGGFDPIPSTWMSVSVTPAELARLAHSFRARYRANVARDQAERAAVDWAAVIADVDAGLPDVWYMSTDYFGPTWNHYTAAYMSQPSIGWAQASYFVLGMADQSGMYQDWLSKPPDNRQPNFDDGRPRLIITPDKRFPQGATEAAQVANPGMTHPLTPSPHVSIGHKDWRQPGRGTYRWSYYRSTHMDFHRTQGTGTATPEITPTEMRMLKAEGYIRQNNPGAAAALINVSRTAAGLNATDAQGTNTSCVPKLPNGQCGNLLEMMKWEKRLETMVWGVHTVSWFFDGRGWGDLYAGTATTFPIPCQDMELLLQECNTFGGVPGERGSAAVSTYNYPFEG
jgi:hypothetical protein